MGRRKLIRKPEPQLFQWEKTSASRGGHGSSVVKVTGSLLVYHEFESFELLNLLRAPASVVVMRGGVPAPKCRPHHLTMVQDYEVCRQKPLCS
ncbi:hypothetical protein TNCV_4150621 [Trichonephila clavipes]|nr:hypothetical protein TNCV_4150621 [Trichonephila clavipes]